jgi:hypothetical protein
VKAGGRRKTEEASTELDLNPPRTGTTRIGRDRTTRRNQGLGTEQELTHSRLEEEDEIMNKMNRNKG